VLESAATYPDVGAHSPGRGGAKSPVRLFYARQLYLQSNGDRQHHSTTTTTTIIIIIIIIIIAR